MALRAVLLGLVLTFSLGYANTWVRAQDAPTPPAAEQAPGDPTSQPATPDKDDEYYELYKVLADTLDQVERNYVKDVSRRELFEAAIHGVLEKLDPYSNYISPEEISRFKTSVENQFSGIGIQAAMEGGQLKVLGLLAGTPAYYAGLQAGDAIVEIEGKSTEGIDIEGAIHQLKGEPGTPVTITVIPVGTVERKTLTIRREIIRVDTVMGDRRKPDDTWDFMYDHDKHIGYVRISGFSRDTAYDLQRALEDLTGQGLKGLILDLRFNPGGLLTSAIDISDLFISQGKIVSTVGRNSPERTWEAKEPGTYEGFPMAILVNHYSASASEIVSACLQDHNRAVIIGDRTWGKGSVQNVIELEGGKSALKLTTASYQRPNGHKIHRFPDDQETDEWGVMPSPGYEIKLDDNEMREFLRVRHDRDLLLVRHTPPVEATPADPATTEKPAEDTPEGTPTEGDQPATEPPADAPPAAATDVYVDRQLQKALEYLSVELAKAQ